MLPADVLEQLVPASTGTGGPCGDAGPALLAVVVELSNNVDSQLGDGNAVLVDLERVL